MSEGNAGNSGSSGRPVGKPWQPGQSGNPNGRSKVAAEVRALARQHCPEAIDTLVRLMRESDDERVRLSAAESLLDRGVGKPAQAVEVSGPDGEPILVQARKQAEQWLKKPETAAALLALAEASEPEAQA
jgi:hypothetical protein